MVRAPLLLLAAAIVLGAGASSAHAATGFITTVAGTGTAGSTGDGGPAASAQISSPTNLKALADGGYLIVAQGSSSVRRVLPNGTITTLATGLNAPNDADQLPDGSFLIADSDNNRVIRVDTNGNISTVAGTGGVGYNGDNISATSATVAFPNGLAVLADGSYLISDNDNHRIRRVSNGTITTVAGTGSPGFGGDGGQATLAPINSPADVAATPDGGFLFVDNGNNRVRKVASVGGNISTVAGNGTPGFSGDGGPATSASLNQPIGVAPTTGTGFLIADRLNHRVRAVDGNGTITTFAGDGVAGFAGDDGPPAQARVNQPFGVDLNTEGDVLIADTVNHRIRHVDLGDPPPPPPPPPPPDPPNPPASVELGLTSATRTPGDANGVTAIVRRVRGSVAAGVEVRYAITGPNPGSGRQTTNVDGAVTINWEGIRDGTDTITVWLDQDGDGVQDATEPSDSATVNWVLPAPEIRKTVNIEPVSGTVLVKLPKGAAVNKRDPWAVAAQSGFIPLEQAKNVPVNTIVNADRGRIELASAINKDAGNVQTGQFYSGQFQIKQLSGARPITDLVMNATLTCPKSTKKVDASGRTRRSRSLWGNAKGRFRTRGRHSSATVRGTTWFSKDTCTTTTTVVREGTVVVNDFAKGKNVTVKAPKRYTARAKKKKKIKSSK